AEERQRNALARRQRAELEANEGEAYGSRVSTDRDQADSERAQFDAQLLATRETLSRRQLEEDRTRQTVAEMRGALEEAERNQRDLQDRARRIDLDRERARRESDEVAQRLDQLAQERAQLSEALSASERDLETAAVAVSDARSRSASAASALESARAAD